MVHFLEECFNDRKINRGMQAWNASLVSEKFENYGKKKAKKGKIKIAHNNSALFTALTEKHV